LNGLNCIGVETQQIKQRHAQSNSTLTAFTEYRLQRFVGRKQTIQPQDNSRDKLYLFLTFF